MSKQISLGVVPFDLFYYKSCLHMPLMAAVQHFGGDPTRFWTNDVFVYGQDKDAQALGLTSVHYENRPEADILREMGIATDPIPANEALIDAVQAAIEHRSLILVPVDRFSYHSKYNTLYRREHYPHHVLVCGYDRAEQTFEVIDAPETPIEGMNAFSARVGYDSLRQSHRDYLEYCDPAGQSIQLRRAPETARAGCGDAATGLRDTILAHRDRVLSALSCLTEQAAALRSMELSRLQAEPLDIVLRRLFPIDRAKEAELRRLAVALPGHLSPHEDLMRKIQISLKEYKLSLGSSLLRNSLSQSNRESLAASLDRIYRLEREFNLGLFDALEQARLNDGSAVTA